MSQFTKIITSSLRHGNPQEEQDFHDELMYHKVTPLSTPQDIASRLLRDIETLADGTADEDTGMGNPDRFPNPHYPLRIEKLYKQTLFWIRDATSSRREVADKISHALQFLTYKLNHQLDGLRMDIVAELKRSEHPPIVDRIIDTEQQLSEIRKLMSANPKLLEDVTETNVQRLKRRYPLLGIPKLSLRLRDKIVVTQTAVPSHLMRQYNDCQERLRIEKERLHDVEKMVEEATHPNYFRIAPLSTDPRLTLFARRYHYRVLALQKLRILHNHRNHLPPPTSS